MLDTVEKFLIDNELAKPEKTFLVGFSGGCDSLCMLDILNGFSKKYGFKLVALHLNHNWRGEESLGEENNCKKYCEASGIEFISETLLQTEQKTENAAREARYEFFVRQAKKYSNSAIFTAHTQSDNAETLIYRIIKGTGIRGLEGIKEKRIIDDIPIYRPILAISRCQTEDYCNSKGLMPNVDSSNFDTKYKRNFIRHKIMPMFCEINFHAEKSIDSLSKLAISRNKIVDEYIDLILKDIYHEKKILTEKFKNLSEDVMQQIIYVALLKFKLDYDRKKIVNILDFIKSNFDSKAGSTYSLTNDLWVFASSKYIYTINQTKADENKNEICITSEGEYPIMGTDKVFSITEFEGEDIRRFPAENSTLAYVNLSGLNINFTIRTRREGDYIMPFGMQGTMKLKKFLNDKEVPQHKRDEIILLCKDSEILWAASVGLSNKLKVVNRPTHVLELKDK